MRHWFGTGQASRPLGFREKHKGILNLFQPLCDLTPASKKFLKSLLGPEQFQLFRGSFPSYSRKSYLFGPVVSDLHEAWQSVSTISRSKLAQHKPSPTTAKTIWMCRELVDKVLFDQVVKKAPPLKIKRSLLSPLHWTNPLKIFPKDACTNLYSRALRCNKAIPAEAHFQAGQGHSLPAAMLLVNEAHFRVCQGHSLLAAMLVQIHL